MEPRKFTEIMIGGNLYQLSGTENEEYMQQVAIYLNSKLSELKRTDGFTRLPADYQNVLVQLNVADDFFKAKEELARIKIELDEREKELYQVKHELITMQLKMESAVKESAASCENYREFMVLNRPE